MTESEPSLTVNNCWFSSCSSEGYCGGAVNTVVYESISSKLIIWNASEVNFNSYSTSKGGSIYLKIETDYLFFNLKNINFNTNAADNKKIIFVESNDLNIDTNKIYSDNNSLMNESAPFYGCKGMNIDNINESDIIPLVFYLRTTPIKRTVNDGGCTNDVCGFSDYPCGSLELTFAYSNNIEKRVIVNESLTITDSDVLDNNSYSLSNAANDAYFDINRGSFITFVNSKFTYLIFNISSLA